MRYRTPFGAGTRADGLPCGNSVCRPTSEMPSRCFARRKQTGSPDKSWMWMAAPRSWMRTARWKSSNCPLQEAPTPPSGKTLENKRMLGVPCVLKSLFSCAGQNFHLQLLASGAFSSPCGGAFEGGSSISQISLSPQLFCAHKSFSILLDTHVREEQHHLEVSPFAARLPLPSPRAVSFTVKFCSERQEGSASSARFSPFPRGLTFYPAYATARPRP